MLKRLYPRSVRLRLTLWYSGALVLMALILAGASRWAMSASLDHALDQGLRYRLIGLRHFIEENSQGGLDGLRTKLAELDSLGDLFQVFGPHGELMAQSDGLTRHHVSAQPAPDPGARILFGAGGPARFRLRTATQRVYVGGEPVVIQVADPQPKFQGVLNEFNSFLYVTLPVALAIAAFGGFWLSGRALSPVDRIIEEARSIDSANLDARLSVPRSGDELQRLSETLNQMLSHVEQSVLQVRQFTSDASHELRAPLTLIYTAAQFALRRERSPDELKEALQKILREAKRSTDLINQLLWLARSDTGTSRVELLPTDLVPLIEDVSSEMRLLAAGKALTFSTSLPKDAIYAELDEPSFRRMLLILLDNAIKYTREGGRIDIRVIEEADDIAISVTDTGVGIPADNLGSVFDRFWRADKVRSRDVGGTGLGLAIAREIAQSHDAKLTVQSSVGQGSTFTVRLRHCCKPVHVA